MKSTLITLFELDLTQLVQEPLIYRFIESKLHATPVIFNDNTYEPLPIESIGWELTGQGTLPHPRIKFANVNRFFSSSVILYDDLLGATVTRLRLLVNRVNANNSLDVITDFRPDVYQIERKVTQNKLFVEFELAAHMDQQGTLLPKRKILRDTCTHTYRHWNIEANDFDYTHTTCPYAGNSYFNIQGQATIKQNDVCGKRLFDCKLRFGGNALPTRAFPGATDTQG